MAPSKPVLALRALVLVASGVFIIGNPFLVQVLGVRSRWLRSWQVSRVRRKESGVLHEIVRGTPYLV